MWKKNILCHFSLYILALLKLPMIFHTRDNSVFTIIQISVVSFWTKFLFKAKASDEMPISTALQSQTNIILQ